MIDDAIIGQPRVRRVLGRMLTGARLPHALLILGQPGSGKAAVALEIARGTLCTTPGPGACDRCDACRKTRTLNHADFTFLVPTPTERNDTVEKQVARERPICLETLADPYACPPPAGAIRVDRVRLMTSGFSRTRYEGSARVAVIVGADLLNPNAANALLKTLEEPPENSLMVLTAPTPESVLPTILSRCQTLALSPVGVFDLKNALLERGASSPETAAYAASISGGSVRRALDALREGAGDIQDRAHKFLLALVEEREPNTYRALEQLAGEKATVFDVLNASELWLRDVLRFRTLGESALAAGTRGEAVRRLAEGFDLDRVVRAATAIEAIRTRNIRNVNLQLGLVDLWRHVRTGSALAG